MEVLKLEGNTQEIELGYEALFRQSEETTRAYLAWSVNNIDSVLGCGYAEAHPELVAAMVSACAKDFHSVMLGVGLQKIRDVLRELTAPPAVYSVNSTEVNNLRDTSK